MQTTIRGRLTCFCRVCYVMWYGQKDVMNDICDVWDWSCSCQGNHDLHVDDETTSRRHDDGDHDDGDHGVKPVTRWSWSPEDGDQCSCMILAISCHNYIIACDVYYDYASCLLRTTVVNKMIPYNNFKKVFTLTVHRCESSSLRSTTWWSGVIDSNVHIQRV